MDELMGVPLRACCSRSQQESRSQRSAVVMWCKCNPLESSHSYPGRHRAQDRAMTSTGLLGYLRIVPQSWSPWAGTEYEFLARLGREMYYLGSLV